MGSKGAPNALNALELDAYGPSVHQPPQDRVVTVGYETDPNTAGMADRFAPASDTELYDADRVSKPREDEAFVPKPDTRQLTPEALEQKWKELNRTGTQRLQQLADERRQLAEERREMLQLMAQIQARQSQPAAPQDDGNPLNDMPPWLREEVERDETVKAAYKNIGAWLDFKLAKRGAPAQPDPAIRQELNTVKAQLQEERAGRELKAAVEMYGEEALMQYAERIRPVYQQLGNLQAAIAVAAPELIQEHYERKGRDVALRQLQQRQQGVASTWVEGGRPSPSAAPGPPPVVPGESFAATAARLGAVPRL